MTAREEFESARSAQRSIDAALARLESARAREGVRAQRYDVGGGRGGASDAMWQVDARMDMEARVARQLASLRAEVERARDLCEGVRAANPANRSWGDVLELHYCDDLPWDAVARELGISARMAYRHALAALDWIDAVGPARAREGLGQAQLDV